MQVVTSVSVITSNRFGRCFITFCENWDSWSHHWIRDNPSRIKFFLWFWEIVSAELTLLKIHYMPLQYFLGLQGFFKIVICSPFQWRNEIKLSLSALKNLVNIKLFHWFALLCYPEKNVIEGVVWRSSFVAQILSKIVVFCKCSLPNAFFNVFLLCWVITFLN